MKSRFMAFTLRRILGIAVFGLGLCSLSGCNGVGGKDSLLARIDGETVYQEDYDLLLKNKGSFRTTKDYVLYQNLYAKAALAARAVSEYPDLETKWNEYYRDMEPRLLMLAFQRYFVMECLMFSDSELRQFYDEKRHLFPSDSSSNFIQQRGEVAKKLYLERHAAEFAEFIKANAKSPESITASDSISLGNHLVSKYQEKLKNDITEGILEKQGYNVHSLPAVEPREYYSRHKDRFMTAPGYEVYHVQGTDSSALEAMLGDVTTLDQFKQIAATPSIYIKDKHALPYGIGMVSELSEELAGKAVGFVTKALRGQDGNFHKFYLASQVPAKVKDYDRAEPSVLAGIENGEFYDVDSDFVLVSKEGKTVLDEGSLLAFNNKFTHVAFMNVKKHDRLVKMLAETYAFADAAVGYKLNRSWEFRALVRMTRWDYIGDEYMKRKQVSGIVSDDSLKILYDRIGSPIHSNYTYEQAIEDLRLVNGIPLNMYKHEYLMGYRVLYAGKTFDESIPFIYSRRGEEYGNVYRQRLSAEAYCGATVHLFDSSVPEHKPFCGVDELLNRADSLVKAGKRTPAFYAFREIMYAYAEVDSLFERVAYEMGVIQADNEEFLDAEGEYYAFYRMWPKSENAEKAMFSRGFMLNENLGMNDKALEVLEEFVKTYPGSELRESADWLVNNIKSNGKLAEDLMKKISSEE